MFEKIKRLGISAWRWCNYWLMPWRRPLPTGEKLEKEAARLGVTLHETLKDGAQGHTILDEPELQRRVLAVRSARQSTILNFAQTVSIVGTLIFYIWYLHVTAVQKSGELMLQFDQRLNSGGSKHVTEALDEDGSLAKIDLSGRALDDAIDDFLSNYELLAAAYRHDLIDKDMAEDAFSYDLGEALNDSKVRQFIAESKAQESDLYDGVIELAHEWNLKFPAISPAKAAPKVNR